MICTKCHAKIEDGSNFCMHCQADLRGSSARTGNTEDQQSAPAADVRPQGSGASAPQPQNHGYGMPAPPPGYTPPNYRYSQPPPPNYGYGMPAPPPNCAVMYPLYASPPAAQGRFVESFTSSGWVIAAYIISLVFGLLLTVIFVFGYLGSGYLWRSYLEYETGIKPVHVMIFVGVMIWAAIDSILRCVQISSNKVNICTDGVNGVSLKGMYGTIEFNASYKEIRKCYVSFFGFLVIKTGYSKYKLRIARRGKAKKMVKYFMAQALNPGGDTK